MTIAFASAASRAQCTVPPRAVTSRLELHQQLVEVRQHRVLDRRAGATAAPPSPATSPTTAGPLGPDRARWRCRGCAAAGCRRAAARAATGNGCPCRCRCPTARGSPRNVLTTTLPRRRGSRPGARSAPPSAAGTGRRRCAAGRTSRRRRRPRRLVSSTWRILSASIAVEVSAFFSANVPPNPQHSSAPGNSTRSMPADRPQQPQRLVADPQHPQRVAGRVVGDAVRVGRADVGHPEHVDQQLGQLVRLRGDRGRPVGQGVVAVRPGHRRVLVPDRPDARPGRRHHHVVRLERLDVVGAPAAAPRPGSRC